MANKEKLKAALRQRQAGVSALVEAIKKLPRIVPSDLSAKEQWERNGEYVERDAVLDLLATAPPEQADQLVERWEKIAEHGEGTPATDNFYFRCAMERCAAELKAILRSTAPSEQAGEYTKEMIEAMEERSKQPQAASGGALRESFVSREEFNNSIADEAAQS